MTGHPLIFRTTDDAVLLAPRYCGLLAVPDLVGQVQHWSVDSRRDVILDLSEVDELDRAGFRALVWSRAFLAQRGVRLSFVAPPPGVLNDVEEVLLRSLAGVYADVAEAKAAQLVSGSIPAQSTAQTRAQSRAGQRMEYVASDTPT